MRKLIILGAGGHAKVVLDVALALGCWSDFVLYDDHYPTPVQCLNYPIVGKLDEIKKIQSSQDAFVAIGNNHSRLYWTKYLIKMGFNVPTLIHPIAQVSQFACVEKGSLVMPYAVINAGASIGEACIINSAAVIEHDCSIADGVHISPNAALGGSCTIGESVWVGMGANVIPDCEIGRKTIVGAGAVVINDIPSHKKMVGIPAREI